MCLLAIAVEVYLGMARSIKHQVGVPIEGSTVVLRVGQWLVRIVGLVELLGRGEAWQDVAAVAGCGTLGIEVVDKVEVNGKLFSWVLSL